MLAVQRNYVFAIAIFVVIVLFTSHTFKEQGARVMEKIVQPSDKYAISSQPDLRETIAHLFESIKHDPRAPGYVDPSGTWYKGGENPIWQKPLGKKVLILDIDTRNPDGPNDIFNSERMNWDTLVTKQRGLVSSAIINHYLYAMIHGYDYKFYHAQEMKDRHNTWILPHVIREMLPNYQFVIVMDADVVIVNLDLPFEWLFNRWGIQEGTSIAMPYDVEEWRGGGTVSRDTKGLLIQNTGLVIAQNSDTTLEMLEAWHDCPLETRYKGCARWKNEWSHEQYAFSEYIRHDFNKTPETVVALPCNDVMGWPNFREEALSVPANADDDIASCNGTLLRHYTVDKEKAKQAAAGSVMQILSGAIQQNLLGHVRQLLYHEPKNSGWLGPFNTAAQEVKKEDAHESRDLSVEGDGF